MSNQPYEPFVILDRSEAPAASTSSPRRWTVLRGRKPAILLIDHGGTEGCGLELPLAAEGFDVYRMTGRESALEFLRSHPSVLMALVRMDLPGLDPVALIRDLQDIRPGLWIGMLCDPGNKTAAGGGYAAGGVDLFDPSASPYQTVPRLIRSVPWALRLQEAADRRLEERISPEPRYRVAARKASRRAGPVALFALFLCVGIALAVATQSWHETRDLWNAKLDRLMGALESSREAPDRTDRQFERRQRLEQIHLQRQSQEALRSHHQQQLEQTRFQDALRSLPPPQYSR